MMRFRPWFAGFTLIVSAVWSMAAQAMDKEDRQAVIHDQLRAFLSDNSKEAWSHAAPAIQVRFGNPDVFMTMVRKQYSPLYRPRAYTMGAAVETQRGPAQIVHVVDDQGRPWQAIYIFTEENESWKISGCFLQLLPGEDI